MYCRNCGKLNLDNAKFCYDCGNKLTENVNSPQNNINAEQNLSPQTKLNKYAVIGFSLIIFSIVMLMAFIFYLQLFYVDSYFVFVFGQIYAFLQFGVTIAGITFCVLGITKVKKEKKLFALSIVGIALSEIPLTIDFVLLWVCIFVGFAF